MIVIELTNQSVALHLRGCSLPDINMDLYDELFRPMGALVVPQHPAATLGTGGRKWSNLRISQGSIFSYPQNGSPTGWSCYCYILILWLISQEYPTDDFAEYWSYPTACNMLGNMLSMSGKPNVASNHSVLNQAFGVGFMGSGNGIRWVSAVNLPLLDPREPSQQGRQASIFGDDSSHRLHKYSISLPYPVFICI